MFDRGRWSPGYLNCGGLFVAPESTPDDRDHSAADWGTAMHAAVAEAPDAQDPWVTWAAPHRERLWPNRLGEHEVSVSWDCATKTYELFRDSNEDRRTEWKFTRNDNCVVGTVDWWGQLPTGEPWVDDLKTGRSEPDPTSPQILFGLMVRMKEADAVPWSAGRVSHTWGPRTTSEEWVPSREGLWRQVSRVALDAFEEELHWAWVRTVGMNPAARPGAHCQWCPSNSVCDRANE